MLGVVFDTLPIPFLLGLFPIRNGYNEQLGEVHSLIFLKLFPEQSRQNFLIAFKGVINNLQR